jgi:hypothetical protein
VPPPPQPGCPMPSPPPTSPCTGVPRWCDATRASARAARSCACSCLAA